MQKASHHWQKDCKPFKVELRETCFPASIECLCSRLLALFVKEYNEENCNGSDRQVDVKAGLVSYQEQSITSAWSLTTISKRAYR